MFVKPIYRYFALLIAAVLALGTTLAVTASPAPATAVASSTFTPAADSYVIQNSSNSNYGTLHSVYVDNSPTTRAYLRFVVPSNGSTIQSAKLRIYANSASSVGITIKTEANNSWDETKITYANAPAAGTTLKTSAAVKAATWIEVDVTSYIKTAGTYSLVVTTTGATRIDLASREDSSHAPQLVITYAAAATVTKVPTKAATPTKLPTQAPTATKVPTQAPTITKAPTQAPTATSQPGNGYQPSFPIRAAFYYPWFPEAWTQKGIYPYTNYTPQLGFYDSNDIATIKKHIAMMQYGNIQAAIASWWGQGSQTDSKISGLLAAAAGTNFRWSLYYENESMGDPSVSQIHSDLVYIRDHYAQDPGYLRVNGKFVMFVYADTADGCGMATRWKQANTVGAYVVLKVFPGYPTCADQPDSWHQYSPAVAADQQGNMSYAISPGFWLKGNAMRLGRDINRWVQNVRDMVASGAKWQLVTTFSEWGEGTAVEPATEWASSSGYGQYLDVLHTNGNGTVAAASIKPVTPDNKSTGSVLNVSLPNASGSAMTVPLPPSDAPTGDSTISFESATSGNILLLAGDICKADLGATDYTANCKKTGDLIRSVITANPTAQVQTLGDNVNNDTGSSAYDAEYTALYDPAWGSFLNVTHALVGNHDTYPPSGTAPYFKYFGSHAGPAGLGYYSYNIGTNWHVIVLNAQCSTVGGCSATSKQTTWLRNDLAANARQCVLAVWHQPRFTSGRHPDDSTYAAWWNLLYKYHVDIVANGHNHNYERFDQINPQEQAVSDGIREFIVGTGGAPGDGYSYSSHPLDPNEAIRNQKAVYGVLQLTLNSSSYSWKFLPVSGFTFADSGTTACH